MDRELITPGVYKYYDNSMYSKYEGCREKLSVDVSNSSYDKLVVDSIQRAYPEEIRYRSQYESVIKTISELASSIINMSGKIDRCYDIRNTDQELTLLISTLYGIEYPIDYKPEWMMLMNKYFMEIRRRRGTEDSIKLIILVLERSEDDLYENYDYDDTVITKVSPYHYEVSNPRIKNIEFANYMISKVVEAGIVCTFVGGDESDE